MTEIYGIYAILLLISTSVTLYISFYSWNKRLNPNAYLFSLLMGAVSLWSICEAMQMASTGIDTKILWSQLSYVGIVFIGPFFLLFTMSYTDNKKYLNKKFAALISIVPIFILVLVATNPWYGLIWPSITPTSNDPMALLIYGKGIGFFINAIYTYILLVVGVLLLLQSIIRNPKVFQKQALMILLATMIPIVANVIYLSKYSPVNGLDLTPFAFTISGVLVAYSIFKYKLLDIVPIAYKKLFNKMGSGALVIDSEKGIVDINKSAKEILKIKSNFEGKNVEETVNQFRELYPLKKIPQENKKEIEIENPEKIWLDTLVTSLENKKQHIGWLITFSDISVRKKAEESVQKSLEEKEMLLKEIHHRMKNNLMVISSLLSLQSRYIKDEASKNIFKESQNRARSMALIHELLYQSTDLKRIDFGKFINTLTGELYRIYISNQNLIKLNVDVESVMVDINTAIPLGLIVNELVSNSMKHAFPDGRNGNIKIKFCSTDDNYTLVVEDDGVGFPVDIDLYNTDSLGLRLVNSLTDQIDGKLFLDKTRGSKFIIKFKEESYEDDI
ncbi:signal transduction histidine kinase [Methanobacterium lacus]|uniref:histidine kinase n=1 Tax=Methanobacterium lacus (strain AL-21) TaxID=877455 RepID=F0TCK9_METLA|nr:histidine kinase N-terminal 7TM domain-containing protein [Methanobacterium lacus]ADZ09286.1 signal transduction histidine kinase [Methanobacterium lacus]